MEEPWITAQTLAGIGIVSLLGLAGRLMYVWARNWETKLLKQDRRLDLQGKVINRHENELIALTKDVEHIRDTADETKDDVKQLLRLANGNRSTG